ncbi:MAG: hypothetical protein HGA44_12225 [Cellulomonadaceae bacterium]|nr:hypothetical protein [Cellulomonadaceae bacterium]
MNRTQWEWRFVGADGAHRDRPISPVFTNRFDAETWIGEHWRHLATQGISAAQLTQDGATVAAPLPLG